VKTLAWIAAAVVVATPLAAQERTADQAEDRVHVVRTGDTLWDLARAYLNDPFLWPEIFRLNADVVNNPARIYPRNRLRLPGEAGPEMIAYAAAGPARTVFFPRDEASTPTETHRVRAAGTFDVPVISPGDFYRAGFLGSDREVRSIGRIAERLSPSVITADLPQLIQQYDRLYIALSAADALRPGDRVHFFRPGRTIRQFGRVFHPTGVATVAAVDGAVATVVVVQVYDAISLGDLALPLPVFPVAPGVQPVAEAGPEGSIVAFQEVSALHSTQNIAFVNLGRTTGVSEGDEFVVYRPAERRTWGTLPAVEVARLQVVRVSEGTSAARVVSMKHPALVAGLPVRRVARMP